MVTSFLGVAEYAVLEEIEVRPGLKPDLQQNFSFNFHFIFPKIELKYH